MMNEWSDQMRAQEMSEFWQMQIDKEVEARLARREQELRQQIEGQGTLPGGFYDAMQNFLRLREKLFPSFPADPAWKILVVLARTPEGSSKTSVTGIAHGAELPLTTALRYIAVMEEEGIVERIAHPTDKRQVLLKLSEEGRRRLDSIADKWATRMLWLALVPLAVAAIGWQAFGA